MSSFLLTDGKKGVAQKIVYGAFARVENKAGKPALDVFEEAMNNIMPVLEVKARRIGGATCAELGFLGVAVLTAVQTPLFCGEDVSIAVL